MLVDETFTLRFEGQSPIKLEPLDEKIDGSTQTEVYENELKKLTRTKSGEMSTQTGVKRCYVCQEDGDHNTPKCPKIVCANCNEKDIQSKIVLTWNLKPMQMNLQVEML